MITQLHPQYIINEEGEKTSVVLPLDEFQQLIADLESEEATRELLEIPGLLAEIEQARKEIEEGKVTEWRYLRKDV